MVWRRTLRREKKKHQTKYKLPAKNLERFQKRLWREYVVKPTNRRPRTNLTRSFTQQCVRKEWKVTSVIVIIWRLLLTQWEYKHSATLYKEFRRVSLWKVDSFLSVLNFYPQSRYLPAQKDKLINENVIFIICLVQSVTSSSFYNQQVQSQNTTSFSGNTSHLRRLSCRGFFDGVHSSKKFIHFFLQRFR